MKEALINDHETSVKALLSVLSGLERELHSPSARRDHARLGELLHPDFHEFGRSGRDYTRAEVIALLPNDQEAAAVHAHDLHVRQLAEGLALLTYKSAVVTIDGALHRHSLRSSIWQLGESGWQLLFHQGTPTSGEGG